MYIAIKIIFLRMFKTKLKEFKKAARDEIEFINHYNSTKVRGEYEKEKKNFLLRKEHHEIIYGKLTN